MDYSSLSQPWSESHRQTTRIPLRSSPRFFFAHHPENWELVTYTKKGEGKKKDEIIPLLLPRLSTIPEEPGVNSVRNSGGRIDSSICKARMIDRGWTILEPKNYDYLRVYPAYGGKYHSTKWASLENVAGRMIHDFDHDKFREWRRELMLIGDIKPPHPAIIQLMLIDQNRSISKLEQNQHIPETAVRLKSAQSKFKLIKRAIQNIKDLEDRAYDI